MHQTEIILKGAIYYEAYKNHRNIAKPKPSSKSNISRVLVLIQEVMTQIN